MTAGAITLTPPEGSAWEFLVLFLVVVLGPPLVERARVPGLIGLLLGGFLIGPHGFGLLDAGSHHDPRPRPARAAVPDVRGRRRARPRAPA